MDKPKNLAQLKRYIKAGDTLTGVYYRWRVWRGLEQTRLPLTVQEVNSVAIIFDPTEEGKQRSYSYWAKAKDYIFTEGGYSILDSSDRQIMASYEYADN